MEDVTHARVPRVIVFRLFSGGVAESEQDKIDIENLKLLRLHGSPTSGRPEP